MTSERKTALVTGAGKRVGRAVALELASHGFDVAVHYRSSRDEAEEVATAARQAGCDAWTVAADLALADDVEGLVEAVQARWDRLDLLVNNASLYAPRAFEETDRAHWDRMVDVNLRAPFRISQGLLPQLRATGSALVVHMCDIGADRPFKGYTAYSVSKAGLVMLVKSMAVELAPAVRTIGLSPGHVIWPPDWDETLRDKHRRRIPMGRVGEPEDIARLIRFAALEGTYLNGVVVPVDGGLSKRY